MMDGKAVVRQCSYLCCQPRKLHLSACSRLAYNVPCSTGTSDDLPSCSRPLSSNLLSESDTSAAAIPSTDHEALPVCERFPPHILQCASSNHSEALHRMSLSDRQQSLIAKRTSITTNSRIVASP